MAALNMENEIQHEEHELQLNDPNDALNMENEIQQEEHELQLNNTNDAPNVDDVIEHEEREVALNAEADESALSDEGGSLNIFLSSRNTADSWFLTNDKAIVQMIFVKNIDGKYFIYGRELENKNDFFKQPLSSSKIDIYESDGKKRDAMYYAVDTIRTKLLCLDYKKEKKIICIAVLHTLDFFHKKTM